MSNFNGWQKTGKVLGKGGQGEVSLVRRPRGQGRSEALYTVVQQMATMRTEGSSPRTLNAVGAFVDAITKASSTDADDLGALKEFSIEGPTGSLVEQMQAVLEGDADKAMGRLKQEIEALRDLDDEPGILRLLDANADERWMITEYHPGTLSGERDTHKGDVKGALAAFRPLVAAVAALHAKGIMHRDVKPDNIFVSRDGDLVLGDFGIVFYASGDATRLTSTFGEKVGTTDWMAPWARVKRRIEEVVPSFDVFPLGKVLWSMVSGQADLPYWWWERDDYNLERLFPDEPQMRFVNDILRRSVVDMESACLSTAGELLRVVDGILPAVRGGGQPIGADQSRRCLVCGHGHYADKGMRRLDLVSNEDQSDGVGGIRAPSKERWTIRAGTCNQCGHVQFFRYPDRLPPPLWQD